MKQSSSRINAMRPVVAALADLTAQRDELSLVRRLFIAIDDIWTGAACWLVRTPPECYASEDNLIVLGDAPGLPVSLAVIGLQLKSRDSINQYYYEARHFILAHIAQPGGIDEDLLVVQVETELGDDDLALFRDLLQVYKNHLTSLAIGDRDALTGLQRKKTFLDRVTEQIDARMSGRRYRAEGNADYLAIISPDNFRAFNDAHGHFLGDLLLRALSRALEEALREGDLLFRLGGKEFAAIVYDLSPTEVTEVFERIRAHVADQARVNDIPISVSIGSTALCAPALPHDLLDEARQALAQAAEEGGNRVRIADSTVALASDDASADAGKHIELF